MEETKLEKLARVSGVKQHRAGPTRKSGQAFEKVDTLRAEAGSRSAPIRTPLSM